MWVFWIYVPAKTKRTQILEERVVIGTNVVSDVHLGMDEEKRRPSFVV
jgi:hypothetical protein